ncbi:hypothetical protein GY14_31985 [Delftia tsuruhatensis]|nr:hypothetical protein GY14_31985 [Delftia tsuruhatensis]
MDAHMSLNDDHLRLLSDAEREAMEADDNDYDPEEDNAAALAALGRGPLDAEEEEEGDDATRARASPSPARPPNPLKPPLRLQSLLLLLLHPQNPPMPRSRPTRRHRIRSLPSRPAATVQSCPPTMTPR